jgi:hypothetical protein
MASHVYVNLQTFGHLVVASPHLISRPCHYDYELLVITSRVAFIVLAGSFERIDLAPTSNVGEAALCHVAMNFYHTSLRSTTVDHLRILF